MNDTRHTDVLRCPTCDSYAPHLHPAVQHEGEVHTCIDAFHLQDTPMNRRWIPTVRAEIARREALTDDKETS